MSEMKNYTVTLPIAGHAVVEVEAASEEDAISQAFHTVQRTDIEEWEALEHFNQGNVCFCPLPWEVKVECDE